TAILTALSIPLIYGASLYYSIYKKTTIYDGFSSSKEEVKEVVLQPTEETPPVQEISKQSPVNIRDIILDALDIDYLKSCLDDLELEADRRSYDSMIDVIRNNKNATAEYLLSDLYVTQIKDICEKVGISSKKKKYELIEVLIQLEREQANVG
ncbi:MAG: hypothetical protein KAJ75_02785, partial [Alphaproteobacteria bacterium]|nr:hypothetical protein [Alphaproteobacteria bacterium]